MKTLITLLALVASTPALAADPCKPFRAAEGNAVLNSTDGLHGEDCITRGPGEAALNNRDAFVGGGQPKEAGDYQAMNAAYVVMVDGRPLHQWVRQRLTDPLPEGAVLMEAPFPKDDRGTAEIGDDFVWISVGVAIDASSTVASLIGARSVEVETDDGDKITVKAAFAVLPGSMEHIMVSDFKAELTVYKFFRKGNGEVYGYVGMRTVSIDTMNQPGWELHLAAVSGWK